MNSINDVFLTCRRSKNMVWRKEDVDRFFELTDEVTKEDNFTIKKIDDRIKKFTLFVIKPRSRFSTSGDLKLGNRNNLVYFEIDGIDNFSDPNYTKLVFCGYAIGTSRILRMLEKNQ